MLWGGGEWGGEVWGWWRLGAGVSVGVLIRALELKSILQYSG